MKKLLTIIVLTLMFGYVQAKERFTGSVFKVELENGIVEISGNQYFIDFNKTRFISKDTTQNLDSLEKSVGKKVSYVVEGNLVTEITLKSPITYND